MAEQRLAEHTNDTRGGPVRGADHRYREAVQAFARAAGESGLNIPLLAALRRLNGVYFLREHLPAREHAAAVYAAARALEGVGEARWSVAPSFAPARLHAGQKALMREVLALAGSGVAGLHGLIATQHALELHEGLAANARRSLLAALRDYLRAVESPVVRPLPTGCAAAWVSYRALNNDRPPREGELAGWAAAIAEQPPRQVLEHALASGLRFDALLDALSAAAAWRLRCEPGAVAAEALAAAHAVRRLTEITGEPATRSWLVVAAALVGTPLPCRGGAADGAQTPSALARLALASPWQEAAAVTEAALVEGDALPAEMRGLVLRALTALLESVAPVAAGEAHASPTPPDRERRQSRLARLRPGASNRTSNASAAPVDGGTNTTRSVL